MSSNKRRQRKRTLASTALNITSNTGESTTDTSVISIVNDKNSAINQQAVQAIESGRSTNNDDDNATTTSTADETTPTDEQLAADLKAANSALAKTRQELAEANQKLEEGSAVQQEVDQLTQQVSESTSAIELLQTQLKEEKAKTSAAEQAHQDLMKLSGNSQPSTTPQEPGGSQYSGVNFNTQTTIGDKPPGICNELMQIYQAAPVYKNSSDDGTILETWDRKEMGRFLKQMDNDHWDRDMFAWGRSLGLYQTYHGAPDNRNSIMSASTTFTTLAGLYLEVLGEKVRMTNVPGFVHHNFLRNEVRLGVGSGTTVNITRHDIIPDATNENDYILSGGDEFVEIGSTQQAHNTGTIKVVMKEVGLDTPVRVPTFISATSMAEIETYIANNLLRNYHSVVDLMVRNRFALSSVEVYNNNNAVTSNPLDVVDGSDGTITPQFLANFRGFLGQSSIRPWMNNKYALVMPTRVAGNLEAHYESSQSTTFRPATVDMHQMLANMFDKESVPIGGIVSGLIGELGGFYLFGTDVYGGGAPGSENVLNVTTGATTPTQIARTCYAVGEEPVCKVEGAPWGIYPDDVTNFRRKTDVTWWSHFGIKDSDVDPTGSGESDQQLRVVKFHALDNAV